MTADNFPSINCDGPECSKATHHPFAKNAGDVRRLRRPEGWRQRPAGRDICPDCWKDGIR
ncbi:hypothetical protein ACFV0B_11230 [Streptomyces xanthophaeus]|uniref:hypothetical protein n=1 Tax=Streptomyces xanthophaeus TaxID=67385 RepID=UPI00368DB261